jgi:hypothetical protein
VSEKFPAAVALLVRRRKLLQDLIDHGDADVLVAFDLNARQVLAELDAAIELLQNEQ